ncbi:MAG: nicotinate (nicotinamide) nucleotide adenylyltransferase [Pseudomonadota bacterium]
MARQIGLLGGSFNPAHQGHLHVASTALKRLQLSEIWFTIAQGNPLKSEHGAYEERCASVGHLIDGYARFKLCEVEAEQNLTYTIDTVSTLRHLYRQDRFVWIMGSDNLETFHRWRAWEQIACGIPIAIVSRPGRRPGRSVFERTFSKYKLPEAKARLLPALQAPAWVYLKAPFHPHSSTAIRNKKSGHTVK